MACFGTEHDHEKNTSQEIARIAEEDNEADITDILVEYQKSLARRTTTHLGFPANVYKSEYMDLSPLLPFFINNLGDPFVDNTVFNSKKFEVEILEWFSRLWQIHKDDYWGYVTSGGTEGNLHGLFIGRELFPDGILYTSQESHYSIFKIARMYRMECEVIKTLVTGEMDYADLQTRLLLNKDKPAIINVTIGTTFKGALDNLDLVIKTLEDCGFSRDKFYIHCDGALNGFMVPFMNKAPQITFKKPIGSVSISGHKFMGCPMPCGVQMTRKCHANVLSKNIDYIGSIDSTILGSRGGHAAIFIWYTLKRTGLLGFQNDVDSCLRKARCLRDRLRKAGISTMLNDFSITVVFERPLDDDFLNRWHLPCKGKMAHVITMQHVTTEMLDKFCEELSEKRSKWYRGGKKVVPCLADDIGSQNCLCGLHKANR